MDVRNLSLREFEELLLNFEHRRNLAKESDEFPKIHDINVEEETLLDNWFAELLLIFDRLSGVDQNSVSGWTDAEWYIDFHRLDSTFPANVALKQFASNRHKIAEIKRVRNSQT